VAVRTGDAGGVHAALQKRGISVNLIVLLPVGVIEARLEQRGAECVEKFVGIGQLIRKLLAPRVAGRASIDFRV
jgi:hypothetical protein